MAERAIREYDGKRLLSRNLVEHAASESDAALLRAAFAGCPVLQVSGANPDFAALAASAPWVHTSKLVAKPDQLIKRRGKGGLLLLNADWEAAAAWIAGKNGKDVEVDSVTGRLNTFLVEPFVPHAPSDEYYICINSVREGEAILFTHEGGIDVGDVDAKAAKLTVPIGETPDAAAIEAALLGAVPASRRPVLVAFVGALFRMYMALHYVYLEINPLVVLDAAPARAAGGAAGASSGVPSIVPLDMAAKLDEAAAFLAGAKWGSDLAFPPPFGRSPEPEEAYIHELDGKTGASLKLTILNRKGRVWTMVAGGGASVVYADTISDLGFGHELANYGEYSGAPSEEQTYEYAKTILKLMGAERLPEAAAPAAGAAGFSAHTLKGKVLIIGGGIANFTDVAKTFAGIIRALREAAPMLIEHHVSVWVRRGGPNYQEGLRLMAEVGDEIGVPIHVYGPDTHITAIVPMALGVADTHGLKVAGETHASGTAHSAVVGPHAAGQAARPRIGSGGAAAGGVPGSTPGDIGGIDGPYSGKFGLSRGTSTAASGTDLPALATAAAAVGAGATDSPSAAAVAAARVGAGTPLAKASPSAGAGGPTSSVTTATATATAAAASGPGSLFHPGTRCIVYGMQTRAVQGMLDFDFLCKRAQPSVAAMVFPFSGNHYQKFYFGTSEMMLPVYSSTDEAVRRHPEVSVFVNFASFRSVYPSTLEALAHPGISTVAIIAEGVPEQQTRLLIKAAEAKGVLLVGPATVGGIAAGSFRIGNTGGQLDNIISCRLYRPGSVGYVSKSGGMSNELNNIMGAYTDGACEGVAIGGDRYPGSRFLDHLLRYEANPRIKMMVLLGEVGGIDEYAVAEAIRDGRLTKPIVAWCIGTCAKMFPFEVQFGHAGALAGSAAQTADAKNAALAAAGAIVPANFNDFVHQIHGLFRRLVREGVVVEAPEPPAPKMPMDFAWAKQLGLIRKPAQFVSSISDDRGEELLYAGVPISKVFEEDLGIGGVVSLLWFRRRLPPYAARFIEMVMMVTADHGPAVSGAHNTIVTARAGKDLISALCSGLLTIGPRFGGALDEAAQQFRQAYDAGVPPAQFVRDMRAANKLIMGIGHRVKSITNPDKRVVIIKEYAFKHFPSTECLSYALAVEKHTTAKKENLILNVDGAIAVCFVDLLRGCGCFTREEADETLANGCLNGLFVLGRSIGFIGHYLDQVRLKQGLYRHPTDDVVYLDGPF